MICKRNETEFETVKCQNMNFDFWLSVLEKKGVVIKLSTNMELEKKYCCIKITNEKQQHGNVHN